MEAKIEGIKNPAFHSGNHLVFLMQIASLLKFSKKWAIQKMEIEGSMIVKHLALTSWVNISIPEFNAQTDFAEIHIESENAKFDEFASTVQTIKGCIDFIQNSQNKTKLDEIMESTSEEIRKLLMARIRDDLANTRSEMNRINNDPRTYFIIGMHVVSEIVPDIENLQSEYWRYIQPLPTTVQDLSFIEEKLNLALGLGLSPLDAAKANFVLMSLWLTKEINNGNIRWDGKAIQNIPTLKPLARQIIELTKKYSARNPQDLDGLILQRAALYFLKDLEGLGETDHAIAKIRSLINAGFIDSQKSSSQDRPETEQTRNDGKALEEKVKEWLQSMGLRAGTTKTTGDGGIDIIAYSESPIFSGKYIVQCKDWAGSVGESVVRDLYGVVMSESANKGILITTGTITKSAQKFADGKPLELINGQELNKLLQRFKQKGD